MNYDCNNCGGCGIECYDDDDRRVEDVCYHCGGTGKVDEETHFHDMLGRVCNYLGFKKAADYQRGANSDPDGEGFDFMASENMLSSYEYFQSLGYTFSDQYMAEMLEKDLDTQRAMIAMYQAMD